MKYLLIISFLLISSCVSFEESPCKGLIQVNIQKVEPTSDCSGKGVKAYSARRLGREHTIKKGVVFLSPGKWVFAYFPSYEIIDGGRCLVMDEILTHGEFTLEANINPGNKYFLKLNNEKEAYIEQVKM